jgi:dihydroflavonol-4-reductase
VFVTGATGFVGTHLARRLHRDGHDLVCLVRRHSRTAPLTALDAELVVGDVTNKKSMMTAMAGCGCAVNLANIYSLWEPDPAIYQSVNIGGTKNVMEAALEADLPRVVHLSTVLVYGKPIDDPFSEASEPGRIRFSAYAESKYQGDLLAWRLHEERDLPLVVLYPGGILGPGDDKFTGALIRRLMDRKLPARMFDDIGFTYVHVADVVDAIVASMTMSEAVGERYILGNERLTMAEFYDTVCELAGVPPPRLALPGFAARATARLLTLMADISKRPPLWGLSDDTVRMASFGTNADGSKAVRELGLRYTALQTALEEAVEWVKQTRHVASNEVSAKASTTL